MITTAVHLFRFYVDFPVRLASYDVVTIPLPTDRETPRSLIIKATIHSPIKIAVETKASELGISESF